MPVWPAGNARPAVSYALSTVAVAERPNQMTLRCRCPPSLNRGLLHPYGHHLSGLRRAPAFLTARPAARAVPDIRLPGALGRADTTDSPGSLAVHHHQRDRH